MGEYNASNNQAKVEKYHPYHMGSFSILLWSSDRKLPYTQGVHIMAVDDEMAKKLYELSEWLRIKVGFTLSGEFVEWDLTSEELKNMFRAMAENDPERWIRAIKSTGERFEEGSSNPHQPPGGSKPN